jgi:hypothetical protein
LNLSGNLAYLRFPSQDYLLYRRRVIPFPLAYHLWNQTAPQLKKDFLPCLLTQLHLMQDCLPYPEKI